MISVQDHRDKVLSAVQRLPAVRLGLTEAVGCVLAQDVYSEVPLPGFDNSSMDGYAVRTSDVAAAAPDAPVVLEVDGDIAAGERRRRLVRPGRTLRIMTGAPMPDGADAVVPVEDTDYGTVRVEIRRAPVAGAFIRRKGEDLAARERVLSAGVRLGARQLAVAAAAGVASLEVIPPPRVAVVSTGDELLEPGRVPGFGQVVDSNGLMLTVAIRELAMVAERVGGVGDTEEEVLAVLDAQLDWADAIVTSGGVSAGAYDAVKAALTRLGSVEFTRVAMQPGKPQGFGTLGPRRVPVFTLPGNPVSALVSFQVFVAPALRVLAGRAVEEVDPVTATAEHEWTSPEGKAQYARVVLHAEAGGYRAGLVGANQGSHVMGGLAAANALAIIPPQVTRVRAGDKVRCLPLTTLPRWQSGDEGC